MMTSYVNHFSSQPDPCGVRDANGRTAFDLAIVRGHTSSHMVAALDPDTPYRDLQGTVQAMAEQQQQQQQQQQQGSQPTDGEWNREDGIIKRTCSCLV
jgi:hypothetical protein